MRRCHGDKVITVNESRDPQQAYDVRCPGCPDCDDAFALVWAADPDPPVEVHPPLDAPEEGLF